jgi:hypothetical protein
MSYFVSYLVSPSLCATSTNTAAEHSSSPTSTNSGLPPIVLICIIASGGTSLPTVGSSEKKTCDLIVTSLLSVGGRSSGKTYQTTKAFFVSLGSISLFLYLRRLRERTRRNEHREKAWQFKDMQREGLRPTLKTDSVSKGHTPIQISDPVLMTEVTSSPRYPTRALHW